VGIVAGLIWGLGQDTLLGIVVGLCGGLRRHTSVGIVVSLCGASGNTLYWILLLVYVGASGDTLHWVLFVGLCGASGNTLYWVLLLVIQGFSRTHIMGTIRSDVGCLYQWVQNNLFFKIIVKKSKCRFPYTESNTPSQKNHMSLFGCSELMGYQIVYPL
jgi:hypothetical protein